MGQEGTARHEPQPSRAMPAFLICCEGPTPLGRFALVRTRTNRHNGRLTARLAFRCPVGRIDCPVIFCQPRYRCAFAPGPRGAFKLRPSRTLSGEALTRPLQPPLTDHGYLRRPSPTRKVRLRSDVTGEAEASHAYALPSVGYAASRFRAFELHAGGSIGANRRLPF